MKKNLFSNFKIRACLLRKNLIFVIVFFVFSTQCKSFAQARVVVNPGLEFNIPSGSIDFLDANFGFGATFDAGSLASSPWYTSHPTQTSGSCPPGTAVGNCHPIEVWGSGFNGVPSAQGTNFVELNAFVNSMIYQNMYLVNGDVITYSFRHRARTLTAEQTAMVIEDQSENNIATVHATIVPSNTSVWSVNSGTYTFTGTTGVYRVGFRALVNGGNGGLGNFLDDIRITLNPIVDLKFSNSLSSCEGSSNGNLFIRISGAVTSATTVAVKLVNPTNGSQFITDSDIVLTGVANSLGTPSVSHVAGSDIYLISIPQGNYDGGTTLGYASPNNDEDGVAININSVNDANDEPIETFKFQILEHGTNGSTNNFVSTSSPVYDDMYYPTTGDYFIQKCVCYDDANTTNVGIDSKFGITNLKKAGSDSGNWPMMRKSAQMVLESNTKGLVITRLTTSQVNAIISPQEGMMVYDTDAKCLKIFDGTVWSCFNAPACP